MVVQASRLWGGFTTTHCKHDHTLKLDSLDQSPQGDGGVEEAIKSTLTHTPRRTGPCTDASSILLGGGYVVRHNTASQDTGARVRSARARIGVTQVGSRSTGNIKTLAFALGNSRNASRVSGSSPPEAPESWTHFAQEAGGSGPGVGGDNLQAPGEAAKSVPAVPIAPNTCARRSDVAFAPTCDLGFTT